MNKLTKNFSFIEGRASKDIVDMVEELERRFLDKDYEPLPNLSRKIAEASMTHSFNLKNMSLNDMIYHIKESYAIPILIDALYHIKKWANDKSHYTPTSEKLSFTNALYIIKSISIILQGSFLDEPSYHFTETPYLESGRTSILDANEATTSVNAKELQITKTSLINWFKKGAIYFKIPFYQREYKWDETQIETLLKDIELRTEDRFQHYFGVIAIKKEHKNDDGDVLYKIIDGQQRITTSLILLRSAYDNMISRKSRPLSDLNEIFSSNTICERYLNDSAHKGATEEFKNILKGLPPIKANWRYSKNYFQFMEHWNSKTSDEINDLLSTFITKFEIAVLNYDIDSEREMDVFENMNSKGTELAEWDLIKNHLFNITSKEITDIEKVELMNRHFSYDFQSNLKDASKAYEEFFTEYCYLKMAKISLKIKWTSFTRFPVYNNFKSILKAMEIHTLDRRQYINFLSELKSFSVIYKAMNSKNFNEFTSLKMQWLALKNMAQKQQLYFVIMKAFEEFAEWEQEKWVLKSKTTMVDVINVVHASILRLEIVKGFGTSFRNLALEIAEIIDTNKADCFDNLVKFVEKSDVLKVKDEEVEFTLSNTPVKPNIATHLLQLIDNYLVYTHPSQKDSVQYLFDKPQLEHVMPKAREKWEKDLKEMAPRNWEKEYDDTLNMIGNFYVLPQKLNVSISNNIFAIKKQEISKLKTPTIVGDTSLNIQPLSSIEEWDFNLIKQRSKAIAKLISKTILKIK